MSALTIEDAFRLFEGLPATEKWSFVVVVADQPKCWRVVSDGQLCSVSTHAAQPKSQRPKADVTTWYKSTELATRDFRSEISEAQWMALYTRGLLRFHGSMAYARKLEAPFKAMLARHAAEGGLSHAPPPPSAAATASAPTGYAPLVDEEEAAPSKGVDALIDSASAAAAPQPWWREHFGTDMLVGCWLMVLGCVLYAVVMVPIVLRDVSRIDKWLELLAALIFCWGCERLLFASYPQNIIAMLERLAAPPSKDKRSLLERYVTGSPMLLATQLFNLGMLPYLLEGAINLAYPPPDDPPGAALSLFLGVLLAMPLLLLFTWISTDDAMRLNRGTGTSLCWDSCLAPCVSRLCGPSSLGEWQRHLGSDGLFLFWVFFVLMAVSLVGLIPMWMMDPYDEQQLCGISMSCAANVIVTAPFTLGTWLMLRATYPENFGASILFPTIDPEDEEEEVEALSSILKRGVRCVVWRFVCVCAWAERDEEQKAAPLLSA